MSGDVAQITGSGPTIELAGKRLTVNPRILRHYGEIKAEIVRSRGNPFDLIRQAKDLLKDTPELAEQFVRRAFDEAMKWNTVTIYDLLEFLTTTWEGKLFIAWLALRDNNRAELTLDVVSQQVCDEYEDRLRTGGYASAREWMDGLQDAFSQADGDSEVGNSSGSPPSPDGGEATT